jgi:hypothetical protein
MRWLHQIEQGSAVVEIYAVVEAISSVSRQGHAPVPPFMAPLGKRFSQRVTDQRGDCGMRRSCELLDLSQKVIREINGGSHASKHIGQTY